ncbi:MAG: glycosyltransferase family 2 protein, partial [Bacteroidota bacterium]
MIAVEVSVVIVNYNGWHYLDPCLTSLFQNVQRDDLEVIVVDNASQDASVDNLERSYP